MAKQPDKRQQFRFWYPFWGTGPSRTPAPAPASASRPSPTNQAKPQATTPDQSQPIKRTTSRSSSLSSSSSSSPSPSSSPAKQNQPKRAPRTTPSPLPSPTQSPSQRSSRLDQVKQKTKGESPQMTPSPSHSSSASEGAQESTKASNQQGTTHQEKMSHNDPIELIAQNPKTINGNLDIKPTSQQSKVANENSSKDLENIEHKTISFDPLTTDMPTKTVIPNKNSRENDLEEGPSKNTIRDHEPKTPVQLDENTIEEVPKTQHEENKQIHNEAHKEKTIPEMDHQENEISGDNIKHMTALTQADNPRETIKEIAKPISDTHPKGTIKDLAAQPSDVGNLRDNYKGKTITTNNNNSSDNRSDHMERENPITNNPKHKKNIDDSPSSTRTSFQKNIKDGISKLVQKINTDNAFNPRNEIGTSIITLAGENKGASMYVGHESEGHDNNSTFTGRARKLDENAAMTLSTGKEEIENEKDSKIAANVNSNVQSINNSMLQESRCDMRDPGVHLRVSSRMKKEKMKKRDQGQLGS